MVSEQTYETETTTQTTNATLPRRAILAKSPQLFHATATTPSTTPPKNPTSTTIVTPQSPIQSTATTTSQ